MLMTTIILLVLVSTVPQVDRSHHNFDTQTHRQTDTGRDGPSNTQIDTHTHTDRQTNVLSKNFTVSVYLHSKYGK